MRILPLLILTVAIGCDNKSSTHKAVAMPVAKTLAVGDPAPPFAVTKWLHGTPVELKPNTAYVIDFWATWCGPCVRAMPHLDELAREFGPQGVEFIAVTSLDDRGNTLAAAERYVQESGKNFGLHFAWCEQDDTINGWMGAANRSRIPCSFLIDKAGKLAFIGSPHELEDVLPKVLAGKVLDRNDHDAIALRETKLQGIFHRVRLAGSDAAERLGPNAAESEMKKAVDEAVAKASPTAIEEFAAFAKEYPKRAANVDLLMQVMVLNLRAGKYDDAKKCGEELLARCQKSHDIPHVEDIRDHWLDRTLNPERQHAEVAAEAADILIAFRGNNDLEVVLIAAEAYAAAKNDAKFQAMAEQARKLTVNETERRAKVEERLKAFQQ